MTEASIHDKSAMTQEMAKPYQVSPVVKEYSVLNKSDKNFHQYMKHI